MQPPPSFLGTMEEYIKEAPPIASSSKTLVSKPNLFFPYLGYCILIIILHFKLGISREKSFDLQRGSSTHRDRWSIYRVWEYPWTTQRGCTGRGCTSIYTRTTCRSIGVNFCNIIFSIFYDKIKLFPRTMYVFIWDAIMQCITDVNPAATELDDSNSLALAIISPGKLCFIQHVFLIYKFTLIKSYILP